MMKQISLCTTLAVAAGLFVTTQSGFAQQVSKRDRAKGIEFFEKKIRPVLVANCYRCHSAESKKSRGGLLVDSRAGLRKGGDSGEAIMPGEPAASLLMKAIEYKDKDLQMPPSKKLPDHVIADFRRWIAMGAPDPRDGSAKVAKKYGSDGKLWCLKSIKRAKVPQVKNAGWVRSPIDSFVLAKLEAKGLHPVGDAEPLALLRRLHYDLVGLPPSPADMERFSRQVKANRQDAIAKEVDRLLASPQFGERWGRHWLDVARYGESNGRDRDVLFPHAWRYRNYVIDAFNAGKPFNRFIVEQVAGDLLPAKDQNERDRLRVATGFLTLGPKSFMKRGKAFEMDLVDEQIDVTTRAFVALTASCARCHDHKFDPIPTKDYYSLASIFASSETLFGGGFRKKGNVNLQPLGTSAKVDPQKRKAYQKKMADLAKRIKGSTRRLRRLKNRQKIVNKKGKTLTVQQEQKRLRKLKAEMKQLKREAPAAREFCMAVADGKPVDLRVMIRGEINKLGEPAPRGFLSCVKLEKNIKVNPKQSGRLELARWLTDPGNPLTARVAVNRIWHHLFGQGLVRTADNFGTNGEKPSHPQLLDHLAKKFMDDGWSFKKSIRYIVLSRTYQLAAAYDDRNYQVDPDNRLLWRRSLRRLDVEAIRDSILAASGKLDLDRPEKSPVAFIGYGEVGRGINTKPLEEPFPYRTVYMPILRTAMPEILKVWDFAEPSLVVGNRATTTVPNQALYLMNSPFVIDNAKALAKRLLKANPKDAARIDQAYKLTLARTPTKAEKGRALAFLGRIEQNLQQRYKTEAERKQVAWTSFCQALFASAEFRYED